MNPNEITTASTKETTVGDVVKGVGDLAKHAVASLRSAGSKVNKADLKVEATALKENVLKVTVSTAVKYIVVITAIVFLAKILFMKSGRR